MSILRTGFSLFVIIAIHNLINCEGFYLFFLSLSLSSPNELSSSSSSSPSSMTYHNHNHHLQSSFAARLTHPLPDPANTSTSTSTQPLHILCEKLKMNNPWKSQWDFTTLETFVAFLKCGVSILSKLMRNQLFNSLRTLSSQLYCPTLRWMYLTFILYCQLSEL